MTFGAGKGVDEFVCIFVGTGIGGAIIQHGELVRGGRTTPARSATPPSRSMAASAAAAGAATWRPTPHAPRSRQPCSASCAAATSRSCPTDARGRSRRPGRQPRIRSGILAKAVKAGMRWRSEIVTEAGTYLGYGLASIVNFLNPQRIILGGGVIEAVDLLFETAERVTRREAFPNAGQGG